MNCRGVPPEIVPTCLKAWINAAGVGAQNGKVSVRVVISMAADRHEVSQGMERTLS